MMCGGVMCGGVWWSDVWWGVVGCGVVCSGVSSVKSTLAVDVRTCGNGGTL